MDGGTSPLSDTITAVIKFWLTKAKEGDCHAYPTEPRGSITFGASSKRRRGHPYETNVKRGVRVVRGDKELLEKLGRNDLCPCGSHRRFKTVLPA